MEKKILWVATKEPWPVVDGGRLLLWNTLRALHSEGVGVTLVAPYLGEPGARQACEANLRRFCQPVLVQNRPRPRFLAAVVSELRRHPWTIERHRNLGVRRQVVHELERRSYDAVVAEQAQALTQIPEVLPSGKTVPPVVFRAQNVESDLWRALALDASSPGPFRWWLGRQARNLADFEGKAVGRCRVTAALTVNDAERLRSLARPGTTETAEPRVEVIPAAVDVELPAGPALVGEPAVVVFGSSGWKPNSDGARDFVDNCWPEVRRRLPGAVLHLFGALGLRGAIAERDGIWNHPAPEGSATALASGSVLVVPLSVASGVRMKILEAWARGVAVVATPVAASGLVAESGCELLIADRATEWAGAVSRAVECYSELTAAARSRLATTYSPHAVARAWLELFGELTGGSGDPRQTS